MKTLFFLTVICGAVMAMAVEEGFHKVEYPGYDDMVGIPGSEFTVHQDDRPTPVRVLPARVEDLIATPPSDAIVLFDGSSLEHFESSECAVRDGSIVIAEGGLRTKEAFGDFQMHIEWRTPYPAEGDPANMGNSGIYVMGRYELQIYDSYSSRIYADGSAAAIYGQTPPIVNVCREPGQWQSYDIAFTAPVFEGESLISPARITVFHNGVLVQNNTEILGPTTHKNFQPYISHQDKLPFWIQGHGSPVEFRNIWIRNTNR